MDRAPGGAIVHKETWVRFPRAKDLTAARQSYIGGTDIAPILGISERTTRFAVWAHKVRADIKEDTSLAEERDAGTFYEPYVLRRFAARYGLTLDARQFTYRRRSAPFLGANPDALVVRRGKAVSGVDAKTRSPFQRGAWGEAGSADVPADEWAQAQWYMEIRDLPTWYLAVFFDRVLTTFVVQRDREFGALAVEEAIAFWNEYILPKKEPPFEGAAAADYLQRKFPRAGKELLEATREDDILVARRDLIKRHMDALAERLSVVQANLMKRIGPAAGIAGTGYTARWYDVQARNSVDWKSVVAELRSFPVTADEEIAWAVREAIDGAIARHTKPGSPGRTFKVFFKKGPRLLPTVELEPVELLALPPAKEDE